VQRSTITSPGSLTGQTVSPKNSGLAPQVNFEGIFDAKDNKARLTILIFSPTAFRLIEQPQNVHQKMEKKKITLRTMDRCEKAIVMLAFEAYMANFIFTTCTRSPMHQRTRLEMTYALYSCYCCAAKPVIHLRMICAFTLLITSPAIRVPRVSGF
jgi:hypothetical protein